MHISDDFVESIFVAIYRLFETRRERAAVTLFLSVLLERNTLPLTGAWGGWVVGGLGGGWLAGGWLAGGWLAGCWLLGMDHWFRYIILQLRCSRSSAARVSLLSRFSSTSENAL